MQEATESPSTESTALSLAPVAAADTGDVDSQFRFICTDILEPTISIFGIASNIVSLVVFSHPKTKMLRSSRTFLMTLCAFDGLYLTLTTLTLFVEQFKNEDPLLLGKMNAYMTQFVQPFVRGFGGASSYLVAVISMERFLALCLPMSSASSFCRRHPWVLILVVLLMNSVFCGLIFFFFKPTQMGPTWVAMPTPLARRLFSKYAVLAEVIYRLLPVATVSALNVCTVAHLYIAREKRREMTSQKAPASEVQVRSYSISLFKVFI
jgi:hypothetical protein